MGESNYLAGGKEYFSASFDGALLMEGLDHATPGMIGAGENMLLKAQHEVQEKIDAELNDLFPTDESLFEASESNLTFYVGRPMTLEMELASTIGTVYVKGYWGFPIPPRTVEDDIYNELIRRNCLG
jgi:hypothetical protein